jgi:hypothetical protein
MSDVFTHAFYGIVLDDKHQQALDWLYDEIDAEEMRALNGDDEIEEDDDIDIGIVMSRVWKHPETRALLTTLQDGQGWPAGLALIRSNDEDDFVGRCATAPGVWLLGVGLFAPREQLVAALTNEAFARVATWHIWATG